ncbi:bacteriorhodopsin [Halocatena marina]|uniref:Bacteriorhodopsin n=1 Tax=Halocatena marina TaxID=2934937 RepID=A0ABD5YSE3_9EURY|nr:bacteriorhodopsin [Halocatena marina]
MAVLLQAGAIDSGRVWLLLGTIGMVFGTTYFVGTGWGEQNPKARRYYIITVAVSAIAAVAYLAMTLGYGVMTVADGGQTQTIYWIHYVDWLLTTPLILLALALLAEGTRRMIVILVGFDASMILFGLVTVITTRGMAGLDSETFRFVLWGASVVAYLGVLGLLVRPLSREAAKQSTEVAMLFSMLRNIVIVLWALYPTIWLLGHVINVIAPTVTLFAYLVVDLLAKIGVGALLLRSDTIREQTTGTRTPTLLN